MWGTSQSYKHPLLGSLPREEEKIDKSKELYAQNGLGMTSCSKLHSLFSQLGMQTYNVFCFVGKDQI